MGRTDLVVVLDEAGTFDLPVPDVTDEVSFPEAGTFDLPVPDVTDEVSFPEPNEELRAAIDELAPAC